ncbi:MAG: hypothetical protein AMK72_15250 [Planctomycetes bacterium SM23_25]|nr:MAG: hypothetical protein AMK72_15250 [Planctomycetes bacterium SM23_25]
MLRMADHEEIHQAVHKRKLSAPQPRNGDGAVEILLTEVLSSGSDLFGIVVQAVDQVGTGPPQVRQ